VSRAISVARTESLGC